MKYKLELVLVYRDRMVRMSAAVSERQHLNTVNVYMKWKCWLRASDADMLVSDQVPGTV